MTTTPPTINLADAIICICDANGWTDPLSLTRGAIGILTGATTPGITLPEGCRLIADLVKIAFPDFKDAGDTAWLIYDLYDKVN